MFANTYGIEGVKHVIQLLKGEIAIDAASLGVPDLMETN